MFNCKHNFAWLQFSKVMKDTSNELDKVGSHVDNTLMHEDSAIVESLQVII